jgi:PAS domain S-box-containing protein
VVADVGVDIASEPVLSQIKDMGAQLKIYLESYDYANIMLVDPDGKVVVFTDEKYAALAGRLLPDFERKTIEKSGEAIFTSSVFPCQVDGQPVLWLITPVYADQGRYVGAVVLEVDMNPIYDFIQERIGLGETGETLVGQLRQIASGPEVLFLNRLRYDSKEVLKRKIPIGSKQEIPMQEAIRGRRGSGRSIDYRGEEVVAAWDYIPFLTWGIVAKMDAGEAFAPAARLGQFILFVALFCFGVMVVAAGFFARYATGALRRLEKGARVVGAGNLDHVFVVEADDEIGSVARAFNKMLTDLKKVTASRDELDCLNQQLVASNQQLRATNQQLIAIEQQLRVTNQQLTAMESQLRAELVERRAVEERLKESEEKYHSVVDSLAVGVALVGPKMEVLAINKKMREWYPDLDISGKPLCYRVFNNPSKEEVCFYCPTYQTLKDGRMHEAVTETPLGGKTVSLRLISSPIKDNNGKVVAAVEVVEDITLEKEVEKSRRLAQLGHLAADVAHEVNNPLMVIMGHAELSLMEQFDNEEIRKNLNIITEQCGRAKVIIQNLLRFSRPSKGAVSLVDLQTGIEDTAGLVEHQFQLSNVVIERHYPARRLLVLADGKQLQEVFLNLLMNARDAMAGQGAIEITVVREGNTARIDFKDSGAGMDKEILAHILDPFYTTKEKGTGLGLSVSYGIIKACGGDLTYASVKGRGTTATIRLPIAEEKNA